VLLLCACTTPYKSTLQKSYSTLDNCQNFIEEKPAPTKKIMILEIKASKMAIKEALTDSFGNTELNVSGKIQKQKETISDNPIEIQIQELYTRRDYYDNRIQQLKKAIK
jgi:hypothetical protein